MILSTTIGWTEGLGSGVCKNILLGEERTGRVMKESKETLDYLHFVNNPSLYIVLMSL